MRVLMVASGNSQPIYGVSSFVYEQTLALRKKGIDVEIFPIIGKGVWGYFIATLKLNKYIEKRNFDIIHSHYIMASIVAILQFKVAVIASFIGCDINIPIYRVLSRLTVFKRAKAIIFVTKNLQNISGYKKLSYIVQYGVDLNKYSPIDKQMARKQLLWSKDDIYIFFASRFDRAEKNAKLAFDALKILKLQGIVCKLIEFKNIKSEELNFYYSGCDLFLLTSIREGSPQSIKEATACNCPIVATDVGDIKDSIEFTDGCYITSFNPEDVAKKIKSAIDFSRKVGRTKGRDKIIERKLGVYDIADQILEIYKKVMNREK